MSDELFLTTFSLIIDGNTAVYFEFFEIQYILQEVLSKSKDESVTYDISRIQGNDSIMSGIYCIAFIECILS